MMRKEGPIQKCVTFFGAILPLLAVALTITYVTKEHDYIVRILACVVSHHG
jgi:hypothetical protein